MKKLLLILCLTIISLAACPQNKKQPPESAVPETALLATLGDFKVNSDIRTYDSESLWEYIDGAADQIILLGFDKMATADYIRDDTSLTVEIYLFLAPQGAFSIFSEYSDISAKDPGLGGESKVADGELMFYEDKYFVYLNCFGVAVPETSLVKIAASIDSVLIETGKLLEK